MPSYSRLGTRLRSQRKSAADRYVEVPGDPVFTVIAEYSSTDNLTNEPLDGPLVTVAKREEVTEIYRRKVWTEALVEECVKLTGKPPIPVRWVSTN